MGRATEGRHGRRRPVLVVLPAFSLLALLLMLSASSAFAYSDFGHAGISCAACHLDGISQPGTNAACIACHGGRVAPSGFDCWTCHKPGVASGTDQAACIGACHTYAGGDQYTADTPHATPHLGSDLQPCQKCHTVTGTSPHHDAQSLAAPVCTACHDGVMASAQTSHDGVGCTSCHTGMNIPPVPSTCNRCHGGATFGKADCLSCHTGAVHDRTPNVGTCTGCHPGAQRHAAGNSCTTCHKDSVKMHHSTVAPADMAARGGTQTARIGRAVGFPATGYPPRDSSRWVLISGGLTAIVALLFLAWRLHRSRLSLGRPKLSAAPPRDAP